MEFLDTFFSQKNSLFVFDFNSLGLVANFDHTQRIFILLIGI